MTFETLEISNYDGAPTTLYTFEADDKFWRYNDGSTTFDSNGETYEGIAISHGAITQSGDVGSDDFEVTIPQNTEIGQMFIAFPPSVTLTLVVSRKHHNDKNHAAVWSGVVRSAKRMDSASYKLTCKALLGSLNRTGLRLSWGRTCPHSLYDKQCGADPLSHSVTTTVRSKTGTRLQFDTVPIQNSPNGSTYDGGFVKFVHSRTGLNQNIGIEKINFQGNNIEVLGITDGINIGDRITLFKGCNRTIETCANVFQNVLNYGGFPELPYESPFDGDQIF
jgi:uncharacterized phage protein (TIGR02218 family)